MFNSYYLVSVGGPLPAAVVNDADGNIKYINGSQHQNNELKASKTL